MWVQKHALGKIFPAGCYDLDPIQSTGYIDIEPTLCKYTKLKYMYVSNCINQDVLLMLSISKTYNFKEMK